MATWKSKRISDAISDIEDEKYVLPVIQRRMVWEEDKMELLFDTLLKGDSFGGIMVIEEDKDSKPLFNYRPFSKDGYSLQSREIDKLSQKQYFVIDGQQRLQTFYIGLKGSFNGKVMYFDLFSDYNSKYEFTFENSQNKLPLKTKDNRDRYIREHNWHRASTLLKRLKDTNDEDQVADEIIESQEIQNKVKKQHIKKNVKAFYKNIITSESLGISKVIINKTLDEIENKQRIVELFRRLNDGGTKLSPFDLVASILKGFAWEMESFLDNTLEDFESIGLSQDNLIKLIFLLQNNHKKEMASIEAKDASFAIDNKERITNTLQSLKNFLVHAELENFYKEANRSFIPLFFIAYHIYHKNIPNNQVDHYFDNFDTGNIDFPVMKKWIYDSLLNGVFRSRGAGWIPYKTGVKKILEEMMNHKDKVFPTSELFEVYRKHPIIFSTKYDSNRLDTLDSSFLYYLLYDRKKTVRKQDVDHIMPKSILEKKKYDWEKINSVKNFQLLDSGTNRAEKRAKKFKKWVNDPKFVKDKNVYLKRHLIPTDESIWLESKFEEFIEERSKLLVKHILKYM